MDKQVRFFSLTSLFVSLIIFVIKFQAYRITTSQAIFSEAMESIVNILAAAMAFGVLWYASKPADKDHPYGHGKAEYLSAALEGGLIAFAAFLIIVESVQAFFENKPLHSLDYGVLLLISTALLNALLGWVLVRLSKKKNSAALEASGKHILADVKTTIGVFIGLTLVVITKIYWLDRLIAILVAVHLIKEGYEVIRSSLGGLLDEEKETVIQEVQELINKNKLEGIIQVHHLRIMRSGNYHHMDAHVVVPEFWSVETAHDETNKYEKMIFKDYSFTGEIHFHIDPCRKLYCQFCDVKNCPVRKEEFKHYREISLTELTSKEEPENI